MIDEDVLRSLLAEAADHAPPPGDLPDDLLEALARVEGSGSDVTDVPVPLRFRRPRPRVLLAAAAAVVLMIGVSAVLADDDGGDTAATALDTLNPKGPDESGTTGGGDSFASTTVPSLDRESSPQLVLPSSADAGGVAAVAPDVPDSDTSSAGAGSGTDSAMVVKTGSLTLEVKRGGYDKTVELMTTKAVGVGGYIAQSSTSRNDDRPSGALVLRVPAAQFDSFLADVRKLGAVVSEDTHGTDVTGQHADLEARLKALQATRDKLGTVLVQAKTVEEILTVQDRITGIQTQIEQLNGELATVEDQVAMASLTVSLGEPGAERVELNTGTERDLGGAWSDARHRFGNGIEGLVAGSGTLAVILLVGGALFAVGRLAWPRVRRYLI